MTTEELASALSGLFAFDSGATDSGIHDEVLRSQVKDILHGMAEEECRLTMSRILRDLFLSEEALAEGYGIEDAAEFIRWLSDRMDTDI